MTRLLFVGPYPPPYGGIASHLKDLLPRLAEGGYQVSTLSVTGRDEIVEESGCTHVHASTRTFAREHPLVLAWSVLRGWGLRQELSTRSFVGIVASMELVKRRIHEWRPDCILVYEVELGLFIPLLRQMSLWRGPIALMVFGSMYSRPGWFSAHKNYVTSVLESADTLFASSHYCADSIRTTLGLSFPVTVIYVGVDESRLTPSSAGLDWRQRRGIPADAFVVLFMGRMLVDMGVDVLLEVLPELIAIGPDVYVVLAGARGDLTSRAEGCVQEMDRAQVCPDVPFEDLPGYYAGADVVLAPTRETQACMGVTIKEAMASGVPVVASNTGGIREAIDDGVHGVLIPVKDDRAEGSSLVRAVAELYGDRELRDRMGVTSRERVLERFTNARTAEAYEHMLLDLMTPSQNPARTQ
jgi:glycosyltransferase involved in cell wall biosynthesis